MPGAMKVAFYGGSFDPPHVAHVLAVTYLLSVAGFARVLVVPVFAHAFDKQLTPFAHRHRMGELAMGWLPRVEVSSIEASLGTPSFTLRTLERLKELHPDYQLNMVVGADVLGERHHWHAFERVVALAPLFVLGRAGVWHPEAPPALLPAVSSTRVRDLLTRRDQSDAARELATIVPGLVLDYIDQQGLYRPG
jgi:nicotinate-nucleotide adenylyltransferase